jgi:hypothetical protein
MNEEQISIIAEPPIVSDAALQLAEVQAIMTLLREHQRLSETRHQEILAGVGECQLRLERLSEQVQTIAGQGSMDSPQLTQILTQVSETRGELTAIQQSLNRPLNESRNSLPETADSNQSPASLESMPENRQNGGVEGSQDGKSSKRKRLVLR